MNIALEKKEISLYSPQLIELIKAVHQKNALLRFQAKGFSMSPFIKDEDILTIAPVNRSIQLGDVVPFERLDFKKLVVHRVIGKKNGYYLIKGDNVWEQDGWIPKKNILGFVQKVERKNYQVQLGLGPEKFLIGILSRLYILKILVFLSWKIWQIIRRKKNG